MLGLVEELRQLLATILSRGKVGTLSLGTKRRKREIFFEKDGVYLLTTGGMHRLVVCDRLSCLPCVTNELLFELAGEIRQTTETLPEVLLRRGLIEEDVFEELYRIQICEEMLHALFTCCSSFLFFEGVVPDALVTHQGYAGRIYVDREEFAAAVNAREQGLGTISRLLPSSEEVFVLTEKGLATRRRQPDFVFVTLCDLIDGLRDIEELVRDSPFYEAFVLRNLCSFLTEGYIKKTVFPELKAIEVATLSAPEVQRCLSLFEDAVLYAADEAKARQRLAEAYLRAGYNSKAAEQYQILGDRSSAMKRLKEAAQWYQKAHKLNPSDHQLGAKLSALYRALAAQQESQGNDCAAVEYLKCACNTDPAGTEAYLKLAALWLARSAYEDLKKLLDKVAAYGAQSGNWEPAVHLVRYLEGRTGNILIKKKMANVYLDMGQSSSALELLSSIAGAYLARGELEKAGAIVGKIARVDPQRAQALEKSLSVRTRPAKKPRRPFPWVKALCALVLTAVASYQLTVAVCYVQVAHASPPEAHSWCFSDFAERFPYSFGGFLARREAEKRKEEQKKLAEAEQKTLAKLLAEARMRERIGDIASAQKLYRMLKERGRDQIQEKAHQGLVRLNAYQGEAAALLARARQLEARGKLTEAFGALKALVTKYGASESAARCIFPIQIRSKPARAQVVIRGISRGTTPFVLHLPVTDQVTVTLSCPGYRPRSFTVQPPGSPLIEARLSRKEAWRQPLPAPACPALLSHSSGLYVPLRNGRVVCLDPESGAVKATYYPPGATSVAAGPVGLNGAVLFATNDARLGIISSGTLKVVPVGELLAPPLVPLSPTSVVVPTQEGRLKAVSVLTGKVLWTGSVGTRPPLAGACTSECAVFLLRRGTIAAFSKETGTCMWVRRLPGATNLVAYGDIVVAASPRKILFLEAARGTPALKKKLPEEAPGFFPSGRGLYLSTNNYVTLLHRRTGRELRRLPLKGPFRFFVPTGRFLLTCTQPDEIRAYSFPEGSWLWYYEPVAPVQAVAAVRKGVAVLEGEKAVTCLRALEKQPPSARPKQPGVGPQRPKPAASPQ